MDMLDLLVVLPPNPALSNPLMYTRLGVLYLIASVKQCHYTVELVDFRDRKITDIPHLANKLSPAKYIAFSATTGEIDFCRALWHNYNMKYPRTKSILGGPHITLLPNTCSEFDYKVAGEGEYALPAILTNTQPSFITCERIHDLDCLPRPDWSAIPANRQFSTALWPGEKYGTGQLAAQVIGSRGCPFSCSFCGNMLRPKVYYHSPARYADDIAYLQKTYGINYFRLEDDNLTTNKKWCYELCGELSKLKIKFKGHTRPTLLDSDILSTLSAAGCEELGIGAESGDDRVLDFMRKGFHASDTIQAVKLIQQAGIRAKIYLMSGLPGETANTVELTKQMVISAQPNRWTLSRFTPYPGTPIWHSPHMFGVRMSHNGHYANYWNFYDNPVYELINATKEELNQRYHSLYGWLNSNQWVGVV